MKNGCLLNLWLVLFDFVGPTGPTGPMFAIQRGCYSNPALVRAVDPLADEWQPLAECSWLARSGIQWQIKPLKGWRMEDGGWRMEDGGWRMEDGGRRMEDGGWRMQDAGWRME